ncbi:21468_t:CDS:2 [Gigaspora rosea]|nr:21468_t:CDS:2 [Gigaspora rosea]
MAKRVFDQVEICKKNIFHKDDKVEIKQACFIINNKPFEIQYRKVNQEKIDTSHINQNLPKDSAVSSTCQRLNKQMQNLVPLLLTNVEKTFVASELTEDQLYITDPDTILI